MSLTACASITLASLGIPFTIKGKDQGQPPLDLTLETEGVPALLPASLVTSCASLQPSHLWFCDVCIFSEL